MKTTAVALGFAACLSLAACGKWPLGGQEDSGAGIPPGATPVTQAPPSTPPAPSSPAAGPIGVIAEPVSFAPIVRAGDPSVVTINVVSEEVQISPFTGRRRATINKGLGSGFVVDKSGVILTNNHVVSGAQEIEVKLSDQRRFPAKVVGTDEPTDIAVVKIDAQGLRPLPLGDSDKIEVGDWVVAIGNPYGLSHTVSAGILSAKGRTRQDVPLDPAGFYDFLQTDASINPGNSGGPLLNLKGEAIGMNSAIRGGGAQGIGFAIPINMIKQIMPMLLRDGHFTRSALGVTILDVHELNAEDRDALKIPKGYDVEGAVIAGVIPGGPADRAGLEPGDLILDFDGKPVDRSARLQWLASTAGVGRVATLRVMRKGKVFDQKVTLGKLGEQGAAAR